MGVLSMCSKDAQIIVGCVFALPTTCIPTKASCAGRDPPSGVHRDPLGDPPVLLKVGIVVFIVMYLLFSRSVSPVVSIHADFTSTASAFGLLNTTPREAAKAAMLSKSGFSVGNVRTGVG